MYFSWCWIHQGNVVGDCFFLLVTTTQTVVLFCVKVMSVYHVQTSLLFLCNIKLCSSLLPYIFVLNTIFLFPKNTYTEGIVRIHVCFCSRWNIISTNIRSVLLYCRYNKTFEWMQYIFIINIYAIINKLSLCNNIIISE